MSNKPTLKRVDKTEYIKINDIDFRLPKPSPRQKIQILELLENYGIKYMEFLQTSMRVGNVKDTETANQKDIDYLTNISFKLSTSSFNAELAGIWLVEKGKGFTESFEKNYDVIFEFAMDNHIEGVTFANFITMIQ